MADQRWRTHVLKPAFAQNRNHRLRTIGLKPRPLRESPSRSEYRQHDSRFFRAAFDFPMPVTTGMKPSFVEPHREACSLQSAMQFFRNRKVDRGVADETVIRHGFSCDYIHSEHSFILASGTENTSFRKSDRRESAMCSSCAMLFSGSRNRAKMNSTMVAHSFGSSPVVTAMRSC